MQILSVSMELSHRSKGPSFANLQLGVGALIQISIVSIQTLVLVLEYTSVHFKCIDHLTLIYIDQILTDAYV